MMDNNNYRYPVQPNRYYSPANINPSYRMFTPSQFTYPPPPPPSTTSQQNNWNNFHNQTSGYNNQQQPPLPSPQITSTYTSNYNYAQQPPPNHYYNNSVSYNSTTTYDYYGASYNAYYSSNNNNQSISSVESCAEYRTTVVSSGNGGAGAASSGSAPSTSGVLDYKQSLDDFRKDSRARLNRQIEERRLCRKRSRSRSISRRSRSRGRHRNSRSRSRSRPRHRHKYNDRSDNHHRSLSERDSILARYRKNYCATTEEMSTKMEELSKLSNDEIIEREKLIWTRTTPADLYYARAETNPKLICGTKKLLEICEKFSEDLVLRTRKVNAMKPKYEPPQRKKRTRLCKHKSEHCDDSDSSSEEYTDDEENIMEELTLKQQHPDRLHPEMWYNDSGEMNDGPLCRCSLKSRKSGIRHGIYAGEKFVKMCNKDNNNSTKLFHYRITISPPINFLTKTPTIIKHDEHEFIFEGFSMFSHFPLVKLPTCKVIRFNIEYTILYIEEKHPDNFTIRELDLFHKFLFHELLELVDLDFHAHGDTEGCSQFHFMPRFVRDLPDNGREILSMKEVLQYLLDSSKPLISAEDLPLMVQMTQYEWQAFADEVKGMIVTYPGKKPCSVRVDQLDRNSDMQVSGQLHFPEIVHFGIRPPQLSYAGNPEYQKAWRDYVKFRHLLANMSKPTFFDKRKLVAKENKLQEMRSQNKMKRDVTIAVSAEGFYRTGIMCDIVQHAMLIPVLVCHLRFHHSLNVLEENINYEFKNRSLLQLALTHPSYRENFGTNPDHARNSLTNCGIRQPEYGDRRIHYMNTRKRGFRK